MTVPCPKSVRRLGWRQTRLFPFFPGVELLGIEPSGGRRLAGPVPAGRPSGRSRRPAGRGGFQTRLGRPCRPPFHQHGGLNMNAPSQTPSNGLTTFEFQSHPLRVIVGEL